MKTTDKHLSVSCLTTSVDQTGCPYNELSLRVTTVGKFLRFFTLVEFPRRGNTS